MSFVDKLRFIIKQNLKDIRRHFCHYCQSVISVYLVILAILVSVTLIEKCPMIFMKLSERVAGQYDGIVYSS